MSDRLMVHITYIILKPSISQPFLIKTGKFHAGINIFENFWTLLQKTTDTTLVDQPHNRTLNSFARGPSHPLKKKKKKKYLDTIRQQL
jgi:hypothetical protein